MKNSYIKKNIIVFLNSTLFKALFFLLIIMSMFTVLNYNDIDIISSISSVFSNYIFLSLCLLPMILFLNNYVYDSFVKDIFAITRFKNKMHYIKELFKNVILSTSIIYVIIIAIVIIMENVLNFNCYKIVYNDINNCNNLIYMIFTIIKLYIFTIIFSLINILLLENSNNKIVVILNFIFFAFLFYCGFNTINILSLKDMSFFVGNYLVNNMIFTNFKIEIISNAIIYAGLTIIFIILFSYTKKQKKDVG